MPFSKPLNKVSIGEEDSEGFMSEGLSIEEEFASDSCSEENIFSSGSFSIAFNSSVSSFASPVEPSKPSLFNKSSKERSDKGISSGSSTVS